MPAKSTSTIRMTIAMTTQSNPIYMAVLHAVAGYALGTAASRQVICGFPRFGAIGDHRATPTQGLRRRAPAPLHFAGGAPKFGGGGVTLTLGAPGAGPPKFGGVTLKL